MALLGTLLLLLTGCSQSPTTPPPPSLKVSPTQFVDVTENSGLRYEWKQPDKKPLNILETIGNGVAFFDFNTDGNLDILLVGEKLALYQGDGKGKFSDVSMDAEISGFSGRFLGCAIGDYDNDGYPDVYISGYRTGLLLHNEAGKNFKNVSANCGIPAQPWGTSAAWADIDGDGKLDLYVGNYVKFDSKSIQYCPTAGIETSCPPGAYQSEIGRLYKNLGGGKFRDITKEAGLTVSQGKTLGVAFMDIDGSGRQSLAIANDVVPGDLFLNLGGKFKSIGAESGIAYSSGGQPHAGMGQDWGDYNNDSKMDITVMTFASEHKPIYRNDGNLIFTDYATQLGITKASTPYVAFGAKWLDADNDGWLDLMITNGHTADNIEDTRQGMTYKQPTLFFANIQGSHFEHLAMPALDKPIVGRGLATGDYDNDGRVDALLADSAGKVVLLHNETPNVGHWLSVKLIGRKGNRDGYGAIVTLETPTKKLTRHAHADGSYLSSSDPRVHFGLDKEATVSSFTIRWQGGSVQTLKNLPTDRVLTITEGQPLN